MLSSLFLLLFLTNRYLQKYASRLLKAVQDGVIVDIPAARIKQIFSNISLIYNVNQMLYTEIDTRVSNWEEDTKLGDIFVDVVSFPHLVCHVTPLLPFPLLVDSVFQDL